MSNMTLVLGTKRDRTETRESTLQVQDAQRETRVTLMRSILSHSLPLGNGALHFHFTGSNFPAKLITRDFIDSSAF